MTNNMKIALVHDYLGEFGGAERVLLALSELYPEAPIYTAFWRPGDAHARFKDKKIYTSWVHHIPGFAARLHSPLRFLAPLIWNSFDFSSYDVVIGSSSWYVTKGFTRKGKAIELCYCHTPPRWLYGYKTSKQSVFARAYGTVVGFFIRQYDFEASQRINYFIANSKETAGRIKKFYRRESTVIYPPIEVQSPKSKVKSKLYYLVVSRLAQPKNIDLAIAAANKLKISLKIVGTGPDEQRLRSLAGRTVEFLGQVADERLPALYAGARAFFALSTDEDFGMTPVEAMAQGTPVIAFRGGGYVETVVEGKTGIFIDELTVDAIISAIQKLQRFPLSLVDCHKQAELFSKKRFQRAMKAFVDDHSALC